MKILESICKKKKRKRVYDLTCKSLWISYYHIYFTVRKSNLLSFLANKLCYFLIILEKKIQLRKRGKEAYKPMCHFDVTRVYFGLNLYVKFVKSISMTNIQY